jgi:hypothetical protein
MVSSNSSADDADWLTAVLSAPTSRLTSHSNAVLTNSLRRLASLRGSKGGLTAAEVDGPEGLLDSIRSRFGTFQLQQFEEVALQLAQLGYQPDVDWLAAFERCVVVEVCPGALKPGPVPQEGGGGGGGGGIAACCGPDWKFMLTLRGLRPCHRSVDCNPYLFTACA